VAFGAAGGNVDTGVDGNVSMPGAYAMDGGNHPAREHPHQVMDNNTRTKWLDRKRGDLVVNFGAAVSVRSYDWATANDAPDRDPVKWSIEGSSDGLRWVPLYSPHAGVAFNPTGPYDRLTYQGPFAVCAGGGNQLFLGDSSGGLTEDTQSPAVTNTGFSSMHAAMGDVNGDGITDLYVSNYDQRNQLFLGNSSGGLTEDTQSPAVTKTGCSPVEPLPQCPSDSAHTCSCGSCTCGRGTDPCTCSSNMCSYWGCCTNAPPPPPGTVLPRSLTPSLPPLPSHGMSLFTLLPSLVLYSDQSIAFQHVL
jgi:hypothetical protein